MLLRNFKHNFLDKVLQILWNQWAALGVPGYSGAGKKYFADPEALIIATSIFGRYDPRLFDGMMNWLRTNGRYINIQRLKNILKPDQKIHYSSFSDLSVLGAVAGYMAENHKSQKWGRLLKKTANTADKQNLFFTKDGKELPFSGAPDTHFKKYGFLRGKLELKDEISSLDQTGGEAAVLKLRALLGLGVRADIILYLLDHSHGYPRDISRKIYYSQKNVQDTLVEMAESGAVRVRVSGREKHYSIRRSAWHKVFDLQFQDINWMNWPFLLSSYVRIWEFLENKKNDIDDRQLLSSYFRKLMHAVRPALESAGFTDILTDEGKIRGEEYAPVFNLDINMVTERMLNYGSTHQKDDAKRLIQTVRASNLENFKENLSKILKKIKTDWEKAPENRDIPGKSRKDILRDYLLTLLEIVPSPNLVSPATRIEQDLLNSRYAEVVEKILK